VRGETGSKSQCNPIYKRREVGESMPLDVSWKKPNCGRWSLRSPTPSGPRRRRGDMKWKGLESGAPDHEVRGGHGVGPRRPQPMVRKSEAGQGVRTTSTTTHAYEYGGTGLASSTAVRRRDTEGEGVQVVQVSVVHISVSTTSNVIQPADHGTFSEMGILQAQHRGSSFHPPQGPETNAMEDCLLGVPDGILSANSGNPENILVKTRQFETSDVEIVLFTNKGGRTEGRILLRTRVSTSQESRSDSLFNLTRREVRFDYQRRGETELSLNNRKDPTLRRMIKVVIKATNGTDLLSFLKDRNWGTPGDRRRNPRWDLLRSYQHEVHTRGVERLEIAHQTIQSQGTGRTFWFGRNQNMEPTRQGHD
jgi:hypothetical protein